MKSKILRAVRGYGCHSCYCEHCKKKVRICVWKKADCPHCGKKALKPLKRCV